MKIGLNDFDIHRILGRGGFGEVYGCRKRDTGALLVTCLSVIVGTEPTGDG